jgi:hypothetical protein
LIPDEVVVERALRSIQGSNPDTEYNSISSESSFSLWEMPENMDIPWTGRVSISAPNSPMMIGEDVPVYLVRVTMTFIVSQVTLEEGMLYESENVIPEVGITTLN